MVQKGIYEVQDRIISHFSFQDGSKFVETTHLKVLGGAGIRIFVMGMLWTYSPMVREDMVVLFVFCIAAAETLYWRLIVLGIVVA